MAQSNWEADKMLDVYIHDYLTKRNLQNSAKAFFAEGKVSSDPVAIDAPGGFLFEWWSVFWDIFIARTNEKHSEVAAAYIETQQMKAREQQQQPHNQQQQQAFHQMQLLRQQQLAQAQAQAQSRPTEALLRQATPTANVMAAKLYEEKLKQDEPALKRFGDGSLDSNQAAVKTAGTAGQPSGPATVTNPVQMRPQLTIQDNKGDVALLNQRSPATDPALFNMKGTMLTPGVNQTTNLLSAKNWSPLAGMDHRLMQQKAFMQSSSTAYQQLHALTPHQQQILFQAQGNMAPQNTMPQQGSMLQQGNIPADVDARRFKILNNRKDGQPNISTDPSPMQGVSSPLTRATSQDQELLLKMKALHQQHANKLNVQNNQDISSYRSSDQIYSGIEPCPSNNSTGTAKTGTRSQNGKKRKQTASSGPANSTGTGNNSPSSPSTHTTGDVNGATHQNGSMSKALMMMYGSEAHSQLHDLDRLEDGLDDNVESFLSHEENDSRDGLFSGKRSPNLNVSKGFTFSEVGCIRASTNKVVCCHFSSDGNLLASAGHEKKAVLWSMDTLTLRSTLEEHSFLITDVRFSPNSTRLATSSFDKTVRVWDADNPSYSLRTLTGHQTSVMSLDFHPTTEDLLCSCDGDSEIRYWSVSQGICTKVFKGGMTQMRFQPRHGRLLAAASENVVSIFDVDGEKCKYSLQRHTKPVHSVCWDATGEYLASVSEDSVRVWTLRSSVGEGECVHELSSNGNKFHSCVFHPTYPYLLIIGCYESLELWNMKENKSMTIPAHHGLIAALAQSPATGMVASASHDKCVKLWR